MSKTQTKPKAEPANEDPSSSDVLKSLMSQQEEGDNYNAIVPEGRIISTGSLLLDSQVKIRSGCVVRFSGVGAELGKTSETLVLMANYMATMPKAKGIFFKAEGRLSPEIRTRSEIRFVDKHEDWTFGTVFVYSGNRFEKVANMLEVLLKDMHQKGEHLCAAIDSLDGLILSNDAEKAVWTSKDSPKVAGVPLLTKLLFRRVALPIVHYDALLIITSQYSAPINLDPYAPAGPRQISGGGGSAAMHQSDYVFEMGQRYNGDYILEDPDEKPDPVKNKIVGIWATYIIKKSGTDVSGVKIRVPIKKGRRGCAIWGEKEVVDTMLAFDMLRRDGPKSPMYAFNAGLVEEAKAAGVALKDKIKGFNNLYTYVETDRAVFEWLYAKFRKLVVSE